GRLWGNSDAQVVSVCKSPCRCLRQGFSLGEAIRPGRGATRRTEHAYRSQSMPAVVLVGAQWGDEGKGKATDLLGGDVDYVVRYQGGNNAGHTVVIGDQKYALHL